MAYPSTHDKRPTREMFSETVVVQIGSSKQSFVLHKGILCFYSGFFDKALNGSAAQADKGVLELANEYAEVFELFVLWLYSKNLEATMTSESYDLICLLWVFADRHEVPLLMNDCIDLMREQLVRTWKVPDANLRWIYAHTTPQAGLRRLALLLVARTSGPHLLTGALGQQGSKKVFKDLLQLVWNTGNHKMTKAEVAKLDTCPYHQHEEGVTCTKKKKKQ